MNAQKVIQDLDTLDRAEKAIFMKLAEIFDNDTPAALYLDFYELAWGNHDKHPEGSIRHYKGNPQTSPRMWEKFLDLPEIYRYRTSKIAKLAEYDAIKAMQSLGNNRENVSALKEIVKQSKHLQGGKQQQRTIVSYVTPKRREAK